MSTLNANSGHPHDPHLAHHFHSLEQQYQSGKLAMWVFLSTEILMFGGLFCAYAVYRRNHPEVFEWAHLALDRKWGAINTVILITSSLTMAWAVRAAMLGNQRLLRICLALTLLGGLAFMSIKFVEYKAKWQHHIWFGEADNVYSNEFDTRAHPNIQPDHEIPRGEPAAPETAGATTQPSAAVATPGNPADPNRLVGDGADAAKIFPAYTPVHGLNMAPALERREHPSFDDLGPLDRQRVFTFFQVYFCMTGLHGIHVLAGMAVISWLLLRSLRGEFGPKYFAPVDLVGLYWHLVDLIWIFLFPLLYLIH
jgi:cytochrome c oxidase subunit 3